MVFIIKEGLLLSIKIGDYTFEGPYDSIADLEDKSGIYAILCKNTDNKYNVVDIGESSKVKTRVGTHDRKECWSKYCSNTNIYCAVYYTPYKEQPGRKEIEQELRNTFDPPCGDR